MTNSKQINQWLGYSGGWIQLPGRHTFRHKVTRVRCASNNWSVVTSSGIIPCAEGLTIEHAVNGETITLGLGWR